MGHKLSYVKPRGGRKPELASISSWVLSVLPGSGSSLQLILSGPAFLSKDSDLPKSWPLRDRSSSVLEHVTSNTRPGFYPQHRGAERASVQGTCPAHQPLQSSPWVPSLPGASYMLPLTFSQLPSPLYSSLDFESHLFPGPLLCLPYSVCVCVCVTN